MTWHLHPDVLLWIATIQGTYLYGLRVVGRPRGLRATHGQLAWFTAGVAVLYVAAGTPLHDLSEERLLSAHMIQHLLMTLVAPPLMLLGTPGWLIEPLLRPAGVLRLARMIAAPVCALMVFNGVTLLTHLPVSIDWSLRNHLGHFFIHVLLITTATVMWLPVLSPTPLLPRLSPLPQMIYLFVQSLVPTVLASFITFSTRVLYEFYAAAPRTWGLSALTDQLVAGLVMKLAGGVVLWIAIAAVFFAWVARENRRDEKPPLDWVDVEAELSRMGLTGSGAQQDGTRRAER